MPEPSNRLGFVYCNATKTTHIQVCAAAQRLNNKAQVVVVDSQVTVDKPELVCNKRVLCVEDGPTLTHGGMPFGAGYVAAMALGAEVVDPRPAFVGTLAETYRTYPTIGKLVPELPVGAPTPTCIPGAGDGLL